MTDTAPAALAARAADELAAGGYESAKVVALVAIAGALTGKRYTVHVQMCPDCSRITEADQ